MNQNARLTFKLVTIKYFDFFHLKMLVFFFAIIYYNISKYQNKNKIIRSLMKNFHKVYISIYNLGNVNDYDIEIYIYISSGYNMNIS